MLLFFSPSCFYHRGRFGEFFRFDGGHCEHFTVANDGGGGGDDDNEATATTTMAAPPPPRRRVAVSPRATTRVSLDFRVIPRSAWRDEFGGRIGSYPCETT